MPGVVRQQTQVLDPYPLLGFGGHDMVESAVLLASNATLGGANEQQTITITGTPAGGTFTLTFSGATTAPIAFNASAATVVAALELLPNIGPGNVTGSGGALPGTPVVITFTNALGKQNVAAMTASGAALTGGTTPAIAITTTTAGSAKDAGLYVVHRGLIVKKASSGGGTNNKVTAWVAGTDAAALVFGVLARTVEFFDVSDISDADVPVWTGPGCVFNDQVLTVTNTNYAGGAANFLTWAQANGNRVGSQGGSF